MTNFLDSLHLLGTQDSRDGGPRPDRPRRAAVADLAGRKYAIGRRSRETQERRCPVPKNPQIPGWKDRVLFTPGPLTTSKTVKQAMLTDRFSGRQGPSGPVRKYDAV